MAKKPEPIHEDQIAIEKLRLFLVAKLEPKDYETANRLLSDIVVAIAGASYKSGIKAGYRK